MSAKLMSRIAIMSALCVVLRMVFSSLFAGIWPLGLLASYLFCACSFIMAFCLVPFVSAIPQISAWLSGFLGRLMWPPLWGVDRYLFCVFV